MRVIASMEQCSACCGLSLGLGLNIRIKEIGAEETEIRRGPKLCAILEGQKWSWSIHPSFL